MEPRRGGGAEHRLPVSRASARLTRSGRVVGPRDGMGKVGSHKGEIRTTLLSWAEIFGSAGHTPYLSRSPRQNHSPEAGVYRFYVQTSKCSL